MKLQNITLACALLASLAACGGGDSSSGSTTPTVAGFDSTAFQGTWRRNDGTATQCFAFNPYGGNYYGLNKPVVFTATTGTTVVTVYNDAACTSKAGILTQTYSLSWSAGSVPGKTNVARVITISTGYSVGIDGNGTGITFTSPPVSGITTKSLLDVEGVQMFAGDQQSAKDADGYPTALQSTALYTR